MRYSVCRFPIITPPPWRAPSAEIYRLNCSRLCKVLPELITSKTDSCAAPSLLSWYNNQKMASEGNMRPGCPCPRACNQRACGGRAAIALSGRVSSRRRSDMWPDGREHTNSAVSTPLSSRSLVCGQGLGLWIRSPSGCWSRAGKGGWR